MGLWPSPRQHERERLEVLRIGREPNAELPEPADHRLVERRLDADEPPLLDDVAIEVVDLRPPAPHDVLQERGPAAPQGLRPGSHVRHHLGAAAPGGGIDEPLRFDAEDRLDLEAAGAAGLDHLGGDLDGDPAPLRLPPVFRRAPAPEAPPPGGPAISRGVATPPPPQGWGALCRGP